MQPSNQLCCRKNALKTKMFLSAQSLYLYFFYAIAQKLGFMIGWNENKFLLSESAAVTWDLRLNPVHCKSELQNVEHNLDSGSVGISGNSDLRTWFYLFHLLVI